MFLTGEQRRRKEAIKKDQAEKRKAIDAANKLRSDRAQRDAWAQSTSSAAAAGAHCHALPRKCPGVHRMAHLTA